MICLVALAMNPLQSVVQVAAGPHNTRLPCSQQRLTHQHPLQILPHDPKPGWPVETPFLMPGADLAAGGRAWDQQTAACPSQCSTTEETMRLSH